MSYVIMTYGSLNYELVSLQSSHFSEQHRAFISLKITYACDNHENGRYGLPKKFGICYLRRK